MVENTAHRRPARRRASLPKPLPDRLRIAEDLLRFQRDGQLLLVAGTQMRPLLVARGVAEMDAVLDAIVENGETRSLLAEGIPEAFLRRLLAHRLVVDVEKPARKVGKPPVASSTSLRAGMSLYLLLAQDCNLGCVYCLNGEETYHRAAAPRMTTDVAFRAIEMCLKRIKPGGSLQIVFFGGEPLLNWPLAKKIIDHVEGPLAKKYPDRKWHFHLTSNLARLPDDLIPRLKEHSVSVLCDIDGPPELHDETRPFKGGQASCERISDNVRALVGEGVPVMLRATVTTSNVSRMVDVARYHRELGGVATAMVAVNPVNSDEAILNTELLPKPEEYAEGLRAILRESDWTAEKVFPFNQMGGALRPGRRSGIACGAPYANTPVVDVNGDIYACIYLVGLPAYLMGSVFDEEHFPDPEVVSRMLDCLYVENIAECSGCSYRFACAGGCPVGHLTVAANPSASEEVRTYQREIRCQTVSAVYEELLWRLAEKAMKPIDPARVDGELSCQ